MFITAPGQSDWLMTAMLFFLLIAVLSVGLVYLRLHALPEHMAHRTNKVQLQFVAVLGLLALFTHNHLFWIAGLLLALVELPDFSTPVNSIARSLERISGRERALGDGSRWDDLISNDGPAEQAPAEASVAPPPIPMATPPAAPAEKEV